MCSSRSPIGETLAAAALEGDTAALTVVNVQSCAVVVAEVESREVAVQVIFAATESQDDPAGRRQSRSKRVG